MTKKMVALAALAFLILAFAAWQVGGMRALSSYGFPGRAGVPAESETPGGEDGAAVAEAPSCAAELCPSPGSPVAAALRGWRDLESFEATVLIAGSNGRESATTEARLWFARPNRFRLQATGSADGTVKAGTTLAFDGQRLAAYLPAEQRVVAVDGAARALLVSAAAPPAPLPVLQLIELQPALDALATRQDARLTVERAEDGQAIDVVAAGPLRVWLKGDTGLPLRVASYLPGGEPHFEVYFTEVFADFRPPDDFFSLRLPASAREENLDGGDLSASLGWRQASPAEAGADWSPLLTPGGLPTGIEVTSLWVDGAGPNRREIGRLSVDGDEAFLIAAAAGLPSLHLPGEATTLAGGGEAGALAVDDTIVVAWTRGDTQLTLIGRMERQRALALAIPIAD